MIDTSYLFNVADSPHSAASIRDISDQLLGMKLPGTHDSVQDAQAALYAAALLLVKGPQKSILRSNGTSSSNGNSDNDNCKLLVHRIPDSCTEEQIKYMMIKNCQIVPTKLEPINRGTGGATGKCNIYFTTERHAQLAFESIAGPNRPDKQNRPQKRIYLRGGGYICVRF